MEESTEAKAKTLKRELKKMVREILSYGGGDIKDRGETETEGSCGFLRAIEEAIRILDCLREVETKKLPSSSSPSPKAEVPEEFKCLLSNAIMIEPVIISTGQTYEKSYIIEWLKHEDKCPESHEDLPHSLLTPNHLVDELITKWCKANQYDRLKPSDEIVTEMSGDGIYSLLERISSPSSVQDQIEAAKELRRQTKRFPNARDFFQNRHFEPLKRFLSLFSGLYSRGPVKNLTEAQFLTSFCDLYYRGAVKNPELQENLTAALFHISTVKKNQTEIFEDDTVIPLLTRSLRVGTPETQRNSAMTLFARLAVGDEKKRIGNSETVMALTGLIRVGDMVASVEATSVALNLCTVLEIREKAISAGMVGVLMDKVRAGTKAAEFLSALLMFSRDERAIQEMEQSRWFIDHLFSILRKPNSSMTWEYTVMIVFNMCYLATPHDNRVRTRLTVVDEEENKHGTFTILTKQGSERVVSIAKTILQWLKRLGTGKNPQMD